MCKIKFKDNKECLSHKARLVIKGLEQQYSVNYFKTFVLVLKFATLQALLTKAAAKDLEIN